MGQVVCDALTMSRPAGASFEAFFPSATRVAREKVKERERTKLQSADSTLLAQAKSVVFPPDTLVSKSNSNTIKSRDVEGPSAAHEDGENASGDLLNGVGSASSHASNASVFSAPSRNTGASGISSLTPITAADSSPGRIVSPAHNLASSLKHGDNRGDEPPRILARDSSRVIKGRIRTYDPETDKNLSSKDRRKAKPIYKDFGLVC